MSASDAIRDLIEPLLTDWVIQYGCWVDMGSTVRHAVIKPAGGTKAELVRRPEHTLILVGALNEAVTVAKAAAESIVEAMRTASGSLVFMQPGEPAFMATNDGRPIFEIAISAITV